MSRRDEAFARVLRLLRRISDPVLATDLSLAIADHLNAVTAESCEAIARLHSPAFAAARPGGSEVNTDLASGKKGGGGSFERDEADRG